MTKWTRIEHSTYSAIYDDLKDKLRVHAVNYDEYYGPFLTTWGLNDADLIKSECRGKNIDNEEWCYYIASNPENND
jgi:hypothetical protein